MKFKDYIKIYENVLSLDVCNKIIETTTQDTFNRAGIGDEQIDTKIRNCWSKPLNKEFDKEVFTAVAKILDLYKNDFKYFELGLNAEDTGYIHLLYKSSEQGEYKKHTDHFDLFPRLLSWSFILNDNYSGGNFSFFDGEDEYMPPNKAGSAIVFPSNFCFPHAVLPVTKGERHSIITWIH